jgi:hypothetical protein
VILSGDFLALDIIVIQYVVCVGCGKNFYYDWLCVWAVNSTVILSVGVCVGCGLLCDTECCVCGLWTAL